MILDRLEAMKPWSGRSRLVVLMGVAVQTSAILYSFINELRLEGTHPMTATLEPSVLRLRPIMMTARAACLGLLPAAMSTGIGSDSQKLFCHRDRRRPCVETGAVDFPGPWLYSWSSGTTMC